MRSYMQTYTCTYRHRYTHTHIYIYVCIYTHANTHTHIHTHTTNTRNPYTSLNAAAPPPRYLHTHTHTCSCACKYAYTYTHLYIYIHLHAQISSLFSHMCTLVISTETIVNIGVFRCCPRMHTTLLLSILFRYIDKSAAEFRSTNIRLYVFGKQNLSEGTRVICCGTQKTSCFLHFSVLKNSNRTSRALCISFGD